jgi:hypothetical protein
MNTVELRTHLNNVKIGEIKNLVRKYNLHYKIKLTQKKPDLINAIVAHFDEIDGSLTSRTAKFDMPSADVKIEPVISTLTKAEKLQFIASNRIKLLTIDNEKFKKFKTDNNKLSLAVRKIKEDSYKIEEDKLIKQGVKITDKIIDNIMNKVSEIPDVKALSKIHNKAMDDFQLFMAKSNEAVNILNSKKPLTVKQIELIYKTFDLNSI